VIPCDFGSKFLAEARYRARRQFGKSRRRWLFVSETRVSDNVRRPALPLPKQAHGTVFELLDGEITREIPCFGIT